MEDKYQRGKIYKIVDVGYTKCYIGSTIETLSNRLSKHRNQYKTRVTHVNSFLLFDEFGVENCKIELIENFPCSSKEELLQREGTHILNNDCINKCVAGRSKKQWYDDNINKINDDRQKYRDEHKEHIRNISKAHRERNKETLNEKRRQYYNDNKAIARQCQKIYYENNKDKWRSREAIKVDCVCGRTIRMVEIPRHNKSNKHKEYLKLTVE